MTRPQPNQQPPAGWVPPHQGFRQVDPPASVDQLLGRPKLGVVDGELTVLRTDARQEPYRRKCSHGSRRWMGFHVEHTNLELEETSLRWWRCDPARVLDNQLFAVTVGTFLVAIYQITGHEESRTRPDEEGLRHRFAGQLLARVSPGTVSTRCEPIPGRLRPLVDRIIHSRITVSSGGPIGHLEAVATR